MPPDDDTLLAFLLGTLPADRVERVREWLEADPSAADRLRGLTPADPLTDALRDTTPDEPVPALSVERVVRAVSDAGNTTGLHTPTVLHPPADTQLAPDGVPVRLGGYRLVRELGRGGMGIVFEAIEERIQRRVAVKVLNADLARRADAKARFLREARAAAAVSHEAVVPIYHVGEDGDTPFIVMPLLDGESLEKRLKREVRLPAAAVARVGRDVSAGLAAAHAKGLVHRDVKPANVWLDAATGRALLLDFGLARFGDGGEALTDAGATPGTPAYMAPELLDGKSPTPRSDLFSLGATLYECATGGRAFRGPTITAVLRAVADHNPPPPRDLNPEVPPGLSQLVVQLLAKNPEHRPASAAEVVAALDGQTRTGGDASTLAWEPTADQPRPSGKTGPPRKITLGCTVTISFLLLVGLGVGLMNTQMPGRPPEEEARGPQSWEPPAPRGPRKVKLSAPIQYWGKVDVLVEREVSPGTHQLLRLNQAGALPLRKTDKFRIEGEVDPPAYLYVVWVDPDHDITPVYPWNPKQGWGTRPAREEPRGKIGLPENAANRYTAPDAKPGVATIVLLARPTPLDVPDEEVERWFKGLPELPLPPGGDGVAVWFDNFVEATDPGRLRTFGEVGSNDAFARWQGQLQHAVGGRAAFETAVSFARTGGK